MSNNTSLMEKIVSLTKRRGFIFPGSDIYGGLSGTWDYGPMGVLLKQKLINLWQDFFVLSQSNMLMIDSAILMNPKVWQASGHTETFTDPMVECQFCHNRFRADKIDLKICPICKKTNPFSSAKNFNLMFQTFVGPVSQDDQILKINRHDLEEILSQQPGEEININYDNFRTEKNPNLTYLRPETAQGIFTNFKNIIDVFYPDMPFGVAQFGKSFRNEISPRDFIFRSREFEQLEIEYFVHPEDWQKSFDHWVELIKQWYQLIGLKKNSIDLLEVAEGDRAHYSKKTIDFEFNYPIGKEEISGLAYRTDFDLRNVINFSNKNIEYRDKKTNQSFIPHVIEPSFGVERMLMALLCQAYTEETLEDGSQRIVLKLNNKLAPILVVVSPLLKNQQSLVEIAQRIFQDLKQSLKYVQYDDNGNIGKRYRRADEIGTPYCLTVDFQTLDDQTVTVRHRDSAKQERVNISSLKEYLVI